MSPNKPSTPSSAKISEAEWQVISVLWETSPAGSADIVRRLQQTTEWSPKTIKTLLSRLVKKGFIATEQHGNRYLYSPKATREETVQQESRSFLSRVFQGDGASLLLHFARSTELSQEQKDELRQLLGQEGDES